MKSIYLDFSATTPLDPEVLKVMMPYLTEKFGNASSAGHHWGWDADSAVQKSRSTIARFLKVNPSEIYFTSGATESNNLALKGVVFKLCEDSPNKKIHVITSCVEHPCVLNTLKDLTKWPTFIDLTILPVNRHGQIEVNALKKAITSNTRLVSFMWVHNELGSINPMDEISQVTRTNKIYFHTDATQAIGKVEIDLMKTPVDLLSFSGHKIYGPKGVGVLFVRSKNPHVQLSHLISGGGQERNVRSGTLNVSGIVGLGEAISILEKNGPQEINKLSALKTFLTFELLKNFPQIQINSSENSSPGNLHVTFKGSKLPPSPLPFGASQGSACASGELSANPVLQAIGMTDLEMNQSLRISLGRTTTETELLEAVQLLKKYLIKI